MYFSSENNEAVRNFGISHYLNHLFSKRAVRVDIKIKGVRVRTMVLINLSSLQRLM